MIKDQKEKKTAKAPGIVGELESNAFKRKFFKVAACPLGLFFASVLMFFLFLWVFSLEKEEKTYAGVGDTVFLKELDNIWSWKLMFKELDVTDPGTTEHLSDIYVTPTADVKIYSKQKSFQGEDVFQANASRGSGQIPLLYQLQSLEYEVTVRSGNKTTTDGELFIFYDHLYYWAYVYGEGDDYLKNLTAFRKTFPIGANNQPITTRFKFNTTGVSHTYYFVACTTPGNVTISYKASANLSYYDYKDFGQKQCSIKQNVQQSNSCTLPVVSPAVTTFAYVNPNPNPDDKPITQLYTHSNRLLPPPVLHVCYFVTCVVTVLFFVNTIVYFWS